MASNYEKRKLKEKKVELEVVYDKIAYDVFWDEVTRSFIRVAIEYNLENGIGKVKETKAIADSQPMAIYKMGELVNRKILRLPSQGGLMAEIKNLANKMVKIMAETKRVAKNGTNSFHNYAYVTEADVMEAVRETLAKYNVFIFSSVIGTDKNNDMTSVVMQHTIVDGDSGESFDVKSFGQGQDKGDKGGPKAVTSATKYFLLKNLLLPTGDDPEATDETGKSTAPKAVRALVSTDSGSPVESTKRFGFSNKTKTASAAPAAVESADEF